MNKMIIFSLDISDNWTEGFNDRRNVTAFGNKGGRKENQKGQIYQKYSWESHKI